jgi:hypothetical protein
MLLYITMWFTINSVVKWFLKKINSEITLKYFRLLPLLNMEFHQTFLAGVCTALGTPKFRGSGCQFPQSQCHPSPRTGIALGTRLADIQPSSLISCKYDKPIKLHCDTMPVKSSWHVTTSF